jgi:ferredoxin
VSEAPVNRRVALKVLGATLGAGVLARALKPLEEFREGMTREGFLQKHYKELTPAELEATLRRLEADTRRRYGAEVTIRDIRPEEDVQFAYALNLTVCIGCRRCAEACHVENNHDRASNNSYIRVLEMKAAPGHGAWATWTMTTPSPARDRFYMPVQCHQCDNAPCVKVCPVEATWKEPTASWWWTTTGASAAGTARRRAPTTPGASTGVKPEIPGRDQPEPGLPVQPHPPGRGDGEVHLLPAPHPQGPPACLPGGLPHRGAGVRQHARSRTPRSARCCLNKRVFVLKEDLGTLPALLLLLRRVRLR